METFSILLPLCEGNPSVDSHREGQCYGALMISLICIRARFLSLARSKLRLCSANHRPGYWSNLPCDWQSTAWAYSEQETENGPWTNGWASNRDSGYSWRHRAYYNVTVMCLQILVHNPDDEPLVSERGVAVSPGLYSFMSIETTEVHLIWSRIMFNYLVNLFIGHYWIDCYEMDHPGVMCS